MKKLSVSFFVIFPMTVFLSIPVYAEDEDATRNILKQGLLGAGTGALAAGTSGGKAGQGALVGAGTAVIGSALLDTLSQPSQPKTRRVYRKPAVQRAKVKEETVDAGTSVEGRKKIIKKYDESGKLVSEEEVYY
jgi:hypothetical protein